MFFFSICVFKYSKDSKIASSYEIKDMTCKRVLIYKIHYGTTKYTPYEADRFDSNQMGTKSMRIPIPLL